MGLVAGGFLGEKVKKGKKAKKPPAAAENSTGKNHNSGDSRQFGARGTVAPSLAQDDDSTDPPSPRNLLVQVRVKP